MHFAKAILSKEFSRQNALLNLLSQCHIARVSIRRKIFLVVEFTGRSATSASSKHVTIKVNFCNSSENTSIRLLRNRLAKKYNKKLNPLNGIQGRNSQRGESMEEIFSLPINLTSFPLPSAIGQTSSGASHLGKYFPWKYDIVDVSFTRDEFLSEARWSKLLWKSREVVSRRKYWSAQKSWKFKFMKHKKCRIPSWRSSCCLRESYLNFSLLFILVKTLARRLEEEQRYGCWFYNSWVSYAMLCNKLLCSAKMTTLKLPLMPKRKFLI